MDCVLAAKNTPSLVNILLIKPLSPLCQSPPLDKEICMDLDT